MALKFFIRIPGKINPRIWHKFILGRWPPEIDPENKYVPVFEDIKVELRDDEEQNQFCDLRSA